jgi:ParB-like chromosome segregation protein Spo0J
MEIKTVKLSEIKSNPNNPRIIKDDKFSKLVKSIQEFPKMLEIRPIVVNADMIVLGGNMRLKACKEAGLKEVPIIFAHDLTEDEQKQFIIKDNVGFGEWDWDMLANEWEPELIEAWGLDVPFFEKEPDFEDLIGEEKNKPATMKITFDSPEQLQKAEIDIQELLDRKYQGAYFSVSAGEL